MVSGRELMNRIRDSHICSVAFGRFPQIFLFVSKSVTLYNKGYMNNQVLMSKLILNSSRTNDY